MAVENLSSEILAKSSISNVPTTHHVPRSLWVFPDATSLLLPALTQPITQSNNCSPRTNIITCIPLLFIYSLFSNNSHSIICSAAKRGPSGSRLVNSKKLMGPKSSNSAHQKDPVEFPFPEVPEVCLSSAGSTASHSMQTCLTGLLKSRIINLLDKFPPERGTSVTREWRIRVESAKWTLALNEYATMSTCATRKWQILTRV